MSSSSASGAGATVRLTDVSTGFDLVGSAFDIVLLLALLMTANRTKPAKISQPVFDLNLNGGLVDGRLNGMMLSVSSGQTHVSCSSSNPCRPGCAP